MQKRAEVSVWGVHFELCAVDLEDATWKINALGPKPKQELVRGLGSWDSRERVFEYQHYELEQVVSLARKASGSSWNTYLTVSRPLIWIFKSFFKLMGSMIPKDTPMAVGIVFPIVGIFVFVIAMAVIAASVMVLLYLSPIIVGMLAAEFALARREGVERQAVVSAIRKLANELGALVDNRKSEMKLIA